MERMAKEGISGEIVGWGTGAELLKQLIKGVEEKTGEKVVSVHGHKNLFTKTFAQPSDYGIFTYYPEEKSRLPRKLKKQLKKAK